MRYSFEFVCQLLIAFLTTVLLCILIEDAFGAEAIIRDDNGRTTATIERDAYGQGFVIRDRSGRTVAVVKPDAYGSGLVIRDRSGRTIGVVE